MRVCTPYDCVHVCKRRLGYGKRVSHGRVTSKAIRTAGGRGTIPATQAIIPMARMNVPFCLLLLLLFLSAVVLACTQRLPQRISCPHNTSSPTLCVPLCSTSFLSRAEFMITDVQMRRRGTNTRRAGGGGTLIIMMTHVEYFPGAATECSTTYHDIKTPPRVSRDRETMRPQSSHPSADSFKRRDR